MTNWCPWSHTVPDREVQILYLRKQEHKLLGIGSSHNHTLPSTNQMILFRIVTCLDYVYNPQQLYPLYHQRYIHWHLHLKDVQWGNFQYLGTYRIILQLNPHIRRHVRGNFSCNSTYAASKFCKSCEQLWNIHSIFRPPKINQLAWGEGNMTAKWWLPSGNPLHWKLSIHKVPNCMWKHGVSLPCSNSKLLGPSFPQWYQYEEFLHVFIIYTSHHVFIKKEKDNKHFALIQNKMHLTWNCLLWGTSTHCHKFKHYIQSVSSSTHLSFCNREEKKGFGATWGKGEI